MKSEFQFCARYTRPWMLPFAGHPAVHCSVTGIRLRSLPGRSRPFQFCWYADTPASSSSLVRRRRRPPERLHARVPALVAGSARDGRRLGRARRRTGDAADGRVVAEAVAARIPVQVQLVARRDLRGDPQRRVDRTGLFVRHAAAEYRPRRATSSGRRRSGCSRCRAECSRPPSSACCRRTRSDPS